MHRVNLFVFCSRQAMTLAFGANRDTVDCCDSILQLANDHFRWLARHASLDGWVSKAFLTALPPIFGANAALLNEEGV